jgi:hypothetical protein
VIHWGYTGPGPNKEARVSTYGPSGIPHVLSADQATADLSDASDWRTPRTTGSPSTGRPALALPATNQPAALDAASPPDDAGEPAAGPAALPAAWPAGSQQTIALPIQGKPAGVIVLRDDAVPTDVVHVWEWRESRRLRRIHQLSELTRRCEYCTQPWPCSGVQLAKLAETEARGGQLPRTWITWARDPDQRALPSGGPARFQKWPVA